MDHEDDDNQFPDCEELVPYVIGSNIVQRNGEKISCWGRITSINPAGDNFSIRTVDDQDITVRLRSPLSEPLEGWVEVHGVAQGKTINCKDFIVFSAEQAQDVDKEGHKAFVQLLTALDDPWNLGESMNGHDGVTPME